MKSTEESPTRRRGPSRRSVWLVAARSLGFALALGLVWGAMGRPAALDNAVLAYGGATILVLVAGWFSDRRGMRRIWRATLAFQMACELVLEGGLVATTGGVASPAVSLFGLTIISSAIVYRLAGTVVAATGAALVYSAAIWTSAGGTWPGLFSGGLITLWTTGTDEFFFALFLRVCVFYLCAFAGGYLAERVERKDIALTNTKRELQAARLEVGEILKNLQSGLITVDHEGRVVYFNRAAGEILRTGEWAVRGKSIDQAFGHNFPPLAERLTNALRSKRPDIRGELSLSRPGGNNGSTLPLGISTSSMIDSQGETRGVIAIFQDLTDAKQLEEKMRAKDRLAAIGELAAAIAHEIRNPLAAISGSVEVLRDALDVSGENRNLLDLIIKESSRLNKILGDFLQYSRIRPAVPSRLPLKPALDDAVSIARSHPAYSSRIPIRSFLPDDEVYMNVDADHLKQMLINLLHNALEALAVDGGEISIIVPPPKAEDETLAIRVRDSGPGVPERMLDKLFQPFASSKPNGTGLGLAVVQRLATTAGGRVELESNPPGGPGAAGGASFVLTLPRWTAAIPSDQRRVRLVDDILSQPVSRATPA